MTTHQPQPPAQPDRRAILTAGLAVAAGAGVATAHGLYQVAAAAHVPTSIAWLYPLITDGLALVAYAATSRLSDGARRYAAGIVVLAAGLSGLAQAVYLSGGIGQTTSAPVGLRFGVGAWPAVAAALTAHLLHLIGTAPAANHSDALTPTRQPPSSDSLSNLADVQPFNPPGVQPYNPTARPGAVQRPRTDDPSDAPAANLTVQHPPSRPGRSRRLQAGPSRRAAAAPPASAPGRPPAPTTPAMAACPQPPSSCNSPRSPAAPPEPCSKTSGETDPHCTWSTPTPTREPISEPTSPAADHSATPTKQQPQAKHATTAQQQIDATDDRQQNCTTELHTHASRSDGPANSHN